MSMQYVIFYYNYYIYVVKFTGWESIDEPISSPTTEFS